MSLARIVGNVRSQVQAGVQNIRQNGFPSNIDRASGRVSGATSVAADAIRSTIKRQKLKLSDASAKVATAIVNRPRLNQRNSSTGIPMASVGNSNILTDMNQSLGAPSVLAANRATGLIDNIGGNVSFGTQSKTQPLIIIGGIIAAVLVALGVKNALAPKRRRRR